MVNFSSSFAITLMYDDKVKKEQQDNLHLGNGKLPT